MELYPIDLAIHLVNIVVLYILLRVLVWKPARKFMAARQERVQKEMDQARQLQAEAEKAKADYDARLADVQATCEKMLADGRKEATAASQKYLDDAKAEANRLLTQARTDADAERQRLLTEAQSQLADLAVDLAGRVLRFDEETRSRVAHDGAKSGVTRTGVLKLAAPCKDEARAAITAQLERLLGCRLELTDEIDPALIGGFIALVDGKAYDFSYAAQLAAVQQKLA